MSEEIKRYRGQRGAGKAGTHRVTFNVSCQPEERQVIKDKAQDLNMTVSELIIEATKNYSGVNKMTLKSYSVNIVDTVKDSLHCDDYIFASSYINDENNTASTNKALKKTLDFLETINNENKIGVLITEMDNTYSTSKKAYIGSGNPINLFSYIHYDGSNWKTVAEVKAFILDLMNNN